MSIEKDLKKDGITVIEKLDALSCTLIAKFVAEKFIAFFPFNRFNYHDLFIKVSTIHMYIADIPEGMAEANYFYKNSSIYFKQGLDISEMKELTIHEFIHHFQERKDKKTNVLYRLGLCDFTGIKVRGMALNEAAVQFISSKILKKEVDTVKYYGIEFSTITPSYYPLICNLLQQMSYITGEQILIDSTLYSNDSFKNIFIKLCGEKTFYKIEKNLDKILNAEEKIVYCNSKLESDLKTKEIANISTIIGKAKKTIQNTFIETQNLILTSYFNNELHNLNSIENIEDYRIKIYSYRDLLGTTEGYSYFNEYYINLMSKLDSIYESITGKVSLVPYKRSILQILFGKLSSIIKLGLGKESQRDF